MSDAATLLPSSSTSLERDLSQALDPLPRVGAAAELIRSAKRQNIPDSVVPWLLVEYGLGELLPYLSDPRTAIATGVLWQRLRGTPESFSIALGWIDNNGAIEESEASTIRWSQFQLGLEKAPVDLSQTDSIVEIARLSSPVRSSLFRIYGGNYDGRRFTLDDHLLSSIDPLCDHTGVYLKSEWPQLSFGRTFQDEEGDISQDLEAILGVHRQTGIRGLYEDRTFLSNSLLGETSWRTLHIEDISACISRLHFSVYGPWWNQPTDWQVAYDWTQVFDWAGLQNKFTPALKFARAGMYLSDYAELGDTNACFPARSLDEFGDGAILLSEADPATGEHILSEHLSRVEFTEINERIEHGTQFGSMWVSGQSSQVSIETWQLEHGTVYTSTSTQNPPAHATLITSLSHYNGVYNNRHDFAGHLFGDGAGHLLGVSSAEIVPTHREHTYFNAYDDSFELSRSRLSEFTPLINEQAISRGHTTNAPQNQEQSDQWQDTESTWGTDTTGTWETVASYFDSLNAGDTWNTETWNTGEYFVNADTDTWVNTYSWQRFPQLEQILGFSRTMLTLSENGHLSDSDGILGDTHATLGFFEDERIERSHQTTSTAHNPSGFWYHLRERFSTLPYDDLFELSRTRLDEFIPLVNQQSITREHHSDGDLFSLDFATWNDSSPSWGSVDWTVSGWYESSQEPTWYEASNWQTYPQLEQVLSFSKAHQTLSDTTAKLDDTNSVLGWPTSERFDRIYFAQVTEDRQSFTTRQHTRTHQTTLALYVEQTWDNPAWAGIDLAGWTTATSEWTGQASNEWSTTTTWGTDEWAEGSLSLWDTENWIDGDQTTWATHQMWVRMARWQVASLLVESQHQTTV